MEIELKLNKDFERFFDKMKEEYGDDFLELNGLSEKKLNLSDWIDSFSNANTKATNDSVADISIDGSSNVYNRDIVTLRSEMPKPHEKLLSYNKIFLELKQKYGLRVAKKWFELEWNKALYLHDANTATFVPYCFAYDLKKIAEEGLFYLPDHNKPEPAQHLETFVDFVKEFINFTSNRTSGACGLPNLIPYMYYYWKKDCEQGIHGLKVIDGEKYAKSQIQRIIYGMNQPYTRDGIQSAFVNTSIFDSEYFDALFGGMEFPDGSFAIDEKDGIMQFEKWFLEEMKGIKDRGRMFTFPVNTISLLRKDGKFIDEDFARWTSNHNRAWNDSNFFCDSSVNSLSNCCRLKSNIEDLGYFNSIGGSALKVGSVKVSTINLARIAYESKGNKKKYLDILRDRLVVNLQALDVIRDIIKKNVERGLLPNFTDGIMDFEHLYNTVGINGVYETVRSFDLIDIDELGYVKYKPEMFEFGKEIFETTHEVLSNFTKDKDYKANVEQVPAESAAVKFLNADKMLYREQVIDDLPLYGNQWIALGINATLKDRIDICSTFDGYCNGGSIMHVNIDSPFATEEQAWDMLNYITDQGVTYFAFNPNLSTDDEGHLFYGNVCPECGSPKTGEWSRTVGFFTKVNGWSKERKEEYKLRKWMSLNEEGVNAK